VTDAKGAIIEGSYIEKNVNEVASNHRLFLSLPPGLYWQVRIFTCPPCFLKRGQDESRGTF